MIFNQPRSLHRRACVSVISALVFFVLFQLLFDFVVQKHRIELRDPEYGYKLTTQKRGIRQNPDRPLLLILGSSRTELGVKPSELHLASAGSEKAPFAFNMALAGSGPLFELLCLKRLLAEGIHPRWVMIEVLPATLYQEPIWSDFGFLRISRISLDELPLLSKYDPIPGRYRSIWLESHAVPWFSNRFLLMSHYAPLWLPQDVRTDHWRTMDGNGFRYGVFAPQVDEATHQLRLVHAEKQYAPALSRFAISDKSDEAMHELLDLCHDQHIPALLYLMPEGDRFRSWYPPAVQGAIRYYLRGLTEEYGTPVVDARTWFHEADFADSHHLLEPAAWAFSKRLGGELNRIGFLDRSSESED